MLNFMVNKLLKLQSVTTYSSNLLNMRIQFNSIHNFIYSLFFYNYILKEECFCNHQNIQTMRSCGLKKWGVWLPDETFFRCSFAKHFYLIIQHGEIQDKSSPNFTVIRITLNSHPNLLHSSDSLCFLFMNYYWVW